MFCSVKESHSYIKGCGRDLLHHLKVLPENQTDLETASFGVDGNTLEMIPEDVVVTTTPSILLFTRMCVII